MNRIVGNVIIVDSAMGNAFILNSANMPLGITDYHVNAIEFYSADTTGVAIFTEADTSLVVKRFGWIGNGAGGGFSPAHQSTYFAVPQEFTGLKVPTLTACSAWIYLA